MTLCIIKQLIHTLYTHLTILMLVIWPCILKTGDTKVYSLKGFPRGVYSTQPHIRQSWTLVIDSLHFQSLRAWPKIGFLFWKGNELTFILSCILLQHTRYEVPEPQHSLHWHWVGETTGRAIWRKSSVESKREEGSWGYRENDQILLFLFCFWLEPVSSVSCSHENKLYLKGHCQQLCCSNGGSWLLREELVGNVSSSLSSLVSSAPWF